MQETPEPAPFGPGRRAAAGRAIEPPPAPCPLEGGNERALEAGARRRAKHANDGRKILEPRRIIRMEGIVGAIRREHGAAPAVRG